MLSQTVEYALRAVACLAGGAQPQTTDQIASQTKVPKAYLSKVLQHLRRSGFISSQRGSGGGIALIVDPADLTILDVINSVEPFKRIDACPLGRDDHKPLCPLHERLNRALVHVERSFADTRFSDLLIGSDDRPLCPTRRALIEKNGEPHRSQEGGQAPAAHDTNGEAAHS